jgi:hypothetical protein
MEGFKQFGRGEGAEANLVFPFFRRAVNHFLIAEQKSSHLVNGRTLAFPMQEQAPLDPLAWKYVGQQTAFLNLNHAIVRSPRERCETWSYEVILTAPRRDSFHFPHVADDNTSDLQCCVLDDQVRRPRAAISPE